MWTVKWVILANSGSTIISKPCDNIRWWDDNISLGNCRTGRKRVYGPTSHQLGLAARSTTARCLPMQLNKAVWHGGLTLISFMFIFYSKWAWCWHALNKLIRPAPRSWVLGLWYDVLFVFVLTLVPSESTRRWNHHPPWFNLTSKFMPNRVDLYLQFTLLHTFFH